MMLKKKKKTLVITVIIKIESFTGCGCEAAMEFSLNRENDSGREIRTERGAFGVIYSVRECRYRFNLRRNQSLLCVCVFFCRRQIKSPNSGMRKQIGEGLMNIKSTSRTSHTRWKVSQIHGIYFASI